MEIKHLLGLNCCFRKFHRKILLQGKEHKTGCDRKTAESPSQGEGLIGLNGCQPEKKIFF
jgi:hypothetical protein